MYGALAGINATDVVNVPWVPFAAIAGATITVFLLIGLSGAPRNGLLPTLTPFPDLALLFLLLRASPDPDPWSGLAYVWVAGLAMNTFQRNVPVLVPLWGAAAWTVLALAPPDGASWLLWTFGHGLALGLLTMVAYAYARERADLRLDQLTGVLERRVGLEAVRSLAYAGRPFQLAFVDLRDFKRVNDLHGHGVGDEVLAAVAGRLANAVRETDPVLRYGGDEFLVASDRPGLRQHLERVLAGPIDTSAGTLPIEVDVGVSAWRPGDSVEALIRQADERMYGRKRAATG